MSDITTTRPARKSTRRRGRGEGSLYEVHEPRKGGGTTTFWRGHFKTASGKRRVLYAHTKSDLIAKIDAERTKDTRGLNVFLDPKLTLGSWLTSYLEMMRPTWRPATIRRAEELRKLHVEPRMGAIPLSKLSAEHIEANLLGAMERDGVGARTRQQARLLVHSALRVAVRRGHTIRNVCEDVARPKHEARTIRPLDLAQAQRFVAAANAEEYGAIYTLAVCTGLRLGELLALQWSDVDFRNRALSVQRSLSRGAKGEVIVAGTKTAAGRRHVHLSDTALGALSGQRQTLLAHGLTDLDRFPYVFQRLTGSNKGGPLRKEFCERGLLGRILGAAKCPKVRFHDLRHTCASLLLSQGANVKIVQETLGHSRSSVTLDVYSHVLPGMARAAMDGLDAALGTVKAQERVSEPLAG